jgi:hypothetical protein
MIKGAIRILLPNPHRVQDIGADLLALRDSGISREDWLASYFLADFSAIPLDPNQAVRRPVPAARRAKPAAVPEYPA